MGSNITAQGPGRDESRKPVDQIKMSNLLAVFDDEKFMKQMVGTHAPDEGEVDVPSLFDLVKNVLRGATGVVDNVVNPKKGGTSHGPTENVVFTPPKQGFNLPVSAIGGIGCQITCKALDTKNVGETMKAIFHELSGYSWVAKSVITLAALALHYADFWRLAEIQPSEKFAESMATLKGLPAIKTKLLDSPKNQVFIMLNDMIKTTLDMTESIVDFERDSKDVPQLSNAIDITQSVYLIIISILACSIQFTLAISLVDHEFRNKGRDLPTVARKVKSIHRTIGKQLEDFMQKKDEIREHQKLERLLIAPSDNVELIKAFIHTKDNPQTLLIDPEKNMDKVESLRGKNVLLLISDLKSIKNDLTILVNIYKECKFRENQYEILWIPIVEQRGEDVMKQFAELQAKMPWYSVLDPTLIDRIAIGIIKEKWHFRQETLVVVLDPQGKVKNQNAMHLIRIWAKDAFPFTSSREATLWKKLDKSWFDLLVTESIFPGIQNAIKAGQYIFLYGGEDSEAINKIEKYLKKIVDGGVSIIFFNANKSQHFWSRLESCMLSKLKAGADILDPLMQDILKLYTSFKKDGGFAIHTKGSQVVINGQLTIATKVLAEYDESRKKQVIDMGFDRAFKSWYEKGSKDTTQCLHFYFPNMEGRIPEYVQCPDCHHMMKSIVKFECCHDAH